MYHSMSYVYTTILYRFCSEKVLLQTQKPKFQSLLRRDGFAISYVLSLIFGLYRLPWSFGCFFNLF